VEESYASDEYYFVEIDENFNIITTPEPGGGVPDGGFPDGEWPQPSGSSDSEGAQLECWQVWGDKMELDTCTGDEDLCQYYIDDVKKAMGCVPTAYVKKQENLNEESGCQEFEFWKICFCNESRCNNYDGKMSGTGGSSGVDTNGSIPGGPGGIHPGDINPGDIHPGGINPGGINPGGIHPGGITPGGINPGDVDGLGHKQGFSIILLVICMVTANM